MVEGCEGSADRTNELFHVDNKVGVAVPARKTLDKTFDEPFVIEKNLN